MLVAASMHVRDPEFPNTRDSRLSTDIATVATETRALTCHRPIINSPPRPTCVQIAAAPESSTDEPVYYREIKPSDLSSFVMSDYLMTARSGADRRIGDDPHRFREVLAELKQSGCRLLVTGDVETAVRAHESRSLFGRAPDRHRVFGVTDLGHDAVVEHLPEGCSPGSSGLDLIRQTETRSSGASVSTQASSPATRTRPFRRHLVDAIAQHRAGRSPDPAELRVGVATLRPLLDDDGIASTRRFVRVIGDETVRSRGMAHFHLGLSANSEATDALLRVVDIHIELRHTDDSGPEHRWTLLNYGERTGWLPMEE
ncbi:DUF7504 family protein [Halomarina oriensis]